MLQGFRRNKGGDWVVFAMASALKELQAQLENQAAALNKLQKGC